MKNRISLLDFIPSVISLFCAIGVMIFFDACCPKADGTWMRCHSARQMVLCVSGCLILMMLIPAFIKNRKAKFIFYIAGFAGGILLFLVPGIIKPLCMMQSMRCYTAMQPYVRIMSAAEILFCIILFIRESLKNKSSDE